eukprot:799053-Amphidinium_carterae.1
MQAVIAANRNQALARRDRKRMPPPPLLMGAQALKRQRARTALAAGTPLLSFQECAPAGEPSGAASLNTVLGGSLLTDASIVRFMQDAGLQPQNRFSGTLAREYNKEVMELAATRLGYLCRDGYFGPERGCLGVLYQSRPGSLWIPIVSTKEHGMLLAGNPARPVDVVEMTRAAATVITVLAPPSQ